MGTFIVATVLAAVIAAVIIEIRNDKKKGKSCSSCQGCLQAGNCRQS